MKRSFLSIFLIITLLFTNAAGYHSHGFPSTASDVLAVHSSEAHGDHHTHDRDVSSSHSGEEGKSAFSDVGEMHSHAFNPAPLFSDGFSPSLHALVLDPARQRFIPSNAVKPLLEPPAHS